MTEIAPNQAITLVFSRSIDPTSVNNASVSIQTPSGRSPGGRLIVDGPRITFEPDVKLVAGATVFGFAANENYIMTLAGGGQGAIRAASGDALLEPITCNLAVSQPPIDPNGRPPAATLLAPTSKLGVDEDITIVVEFDEVIDISGFQGATTATSPVLYRLRPTVGSGANIECDPNAPAVPLPGVPNAVVTAQGTTQVILKPLISLPRTICVEVEVTSRVTDLAGVPAIPTLFSFITRDTGPVDKEIVETFLSSAQLDRLFSAGSWSNGEARPGLLGGEGILGEFDPTITPDQPSPGVYVWDTDNMVIPGSQTTTGQQVTVTDGIFNFSRFELERGETLMFTGSNPPQIIVRGSVDIDGIIMMNAPSVDGHDRSLATGQPGGLGAVAGGAGGAGGDAGDGMGNQPLFNGQDGETVQLMAGHAYGPGGIDDRTIGTGGVGSSQYPADGMWQSLTFNGLGATYSQQVAAGGGGGGFSTVGSPGMALRSCSGGISGTCNTELGPDGVPGVAIDLFPLPAMVSSLDHFLIGGSGGGGGGSHAFWSTAPGSATTPWYSGAAGAGGGGAIAFRVGGDFSMSPGSLIELKGGDGYVHDIENTLAGEPNGPPPSPGGGGSGGSIVIQVGGTAEFDGEIDASGGIGGYTDSTSFMQVETRGGDGSPGFIRFEHPGAQNPSLLGNTVPSPVANNIGVLVDEDPITGFQSLWYLTREIFPPTYLRYELQVEDDLGNRMIYSDDPSHVSSFGPNMGLATTGAPIRLTVQGAQADLSTGLVDPVSAGPWREQVGLPRGQGSLNDDSATAFRFQAIFDKAIATNLVIKGFIVHYQT